MLEWACSSDTAQHMRRSAFATSNCSIGSTSAVHGRLAAAEPQPRERGHSPFMASVSLPRLPAGVTNPSLAIPNQCMAVLGPA